MKLMDKRIYSVLLMLITLCIVIFSSCGQSKSDNIESSFMNLIVETVKENYEDGDISISDIEVEEIFCGTFSQNDVKEILVVCNILNQPHVAGLDKSVCILLTADSFEVESYKEFASDETVIKCMMAEDGLNRILVSEKTTYQGITSQDIQLFTIKDKQWVNTQIEALAELKDENFFLITDKSIIVTSKSNVTDVSDIVALLEWNPATGQFSWK